MKKPSVELIVHCYAEKIPIFASMLTAQLSSLVLWPPKNADVTVTVVCAADDDLTAQTVVEFSAQYGDRFRLQSLYLDKSRLFRRAIGRNEAAKLSTADRVWFIDADYLLGDGAIDAVAQTKFKCALLFPKHVWIHRAHHLGDAEIARIIPGQLFRPNLELFEQRLEKFAIGGLQIVHGDTARIGGYLDGTKWTQPVPQATDFLDTKEDKAFRVHCGGSMPVDIPGVYRMRHSPSAFEPAEKRLAQTADKE
jgi:hypothetical protein